MASDTKVIALYIDFENIEIGLQKQHKIKFQIEPIINTLSELGVVRVRKAYADWVVNRDYRESLLSYGIELIEKPSLNTEGKNGADIKLTIDAVETAITNPNINTFAIVSGDSDFLSLIQKLRENGKYVIILSGEAFTSKLIIKNCDEFISYELIANIRKSEHQEETSLQKDLSHAIDLLKDSLRLLEDEGNKLDYSGIKTKMLQIDPTFTEKKIGFSSFGNFIKSVSENKQLEIEIIPIDGVPYVRSNLNDDDEGFESRPPSKKEWKVIFDAIQVFFTEGKGKKSEGNPWILISYLKTRRDVGLLPISNKSIRDAIQLLIDKDIIHRKKGSGPSPLHRPENFENRKKDFLNSLK